MAIYCYPYISNCLIPFLESVMTPCQKAQKNSSSLPFGDSHLIRCKQDGSYEEVQCSGSTGSCWCVDEKGFQLNRTKTRGPLKCPALGLYAALSAYVYNYLNITSFTKTSAEFLVIAYEPRAPVPRQKKKKKMQL